MVKHTTKSKGKTAGVIMKRVEMDRFDALLALREQEIGVGISRTQYMCILLTEEEKRQGI